MYKERLEICKACPLFDLKGDSCAVAGTQPCCSECGCSIGIKLRAIDSNCPKGKW